eukprot:7376504-Prymnesium_polylepis.2
MSDRTGITKRTHACCRILSSQWHAVSKAHRQYTLRYGQGFAHVRVERAQLCIRCCSTIL